MKTLILLLCIFVVSNATIQSFYDVSCDESAESRFIFERVPNVNGRFALKWCTVANKNVTQWRIRLGYYNGLKPEQCNKDFAKRRSRLHSAPDRLPVQVNSNCTNVCFSATLDAIFSSTCYFIEIELIGEMGGTLRNTSEYYYAGKTNLTIEDVTKPDRQSNAYSQGEDVVIVWNLNVPASQYEVYMRGNGPNDTIYMNCSTVEPQVVRCRARAADGFYTATFVHTAPWDSMPDSATKIDLKFCRNTTKTNMTTPAMVSQLWWALGGVGGALLLGVLALLLLLLQRAARAGKLKQNVLRSWVDDITRRLERGGAARAAERVVLLYARDCEHMERAAQHLAALLQLVTGCEVVDLYSAETVAAAAPAPASWLRAQLLRAGTRVLLVQSPAAAVYCARLARADDTAPALQAPLLGSRVAWRQPHAADSQMLLALRLLTDAAHHEPLPYKKYYVATVAGLQHSDVVPALTPQRRYLLPHAAELLLRDLSPQHPDSTPPAPPPAAARLLRQLTEALEDFRLYALANPNYLFDDLMFE